MIETDRLVLRPLEQADRPWFLAQARNEEVMAMLGGPQPADVAGAKFDSVRAAQAEFGFSFWLMIRKADGARTGICGLKLFDAPPAPALAGELEIGWRLDRAFWGQGYAREAAAAALDRAFGPIGAVRVVAITSERNRASWGLMERLGMQRRPELAFDDPRFPAEDRFTLVYSLEAHQWTT